MEAFRIRVRLVIIEQMLLRTALLLHVLTRTGTLAGSRDALKEWLETFGTTTDAAYGAHFQDPTLTALYSDEARAIIESLKERVDQLAADLQSILRS
jgi:hypothetical protein